MPRRMDCAITLASWIRVSVRQVTGKSVERRACDLYALCMKAYPHGLLPRKKLDLQGKTGAWYGNCTMQPFVKCLAVSCF